jgi:hypothetical protein
VAGPLIIRHRKTSPSSCKIRPCPPPAWLFKRVGTEAARYESMSKKLVSNVLRTFYPGKPLVCGLILAGAVWQAAAIPVTVQELGIDPAHETVQLTSSTLGTVWAYAGIIDLKVNGVSVNGFCIDPFHWSIPGVQNYNAVDLSIAPKSPVNGMGAATALDIEQLWQQYYSSGMSSQNAAGLQIAIWELVGGSNFTLNSTPDYGASGMLNWLKNNANAPTADLIGLTGPGQDYVIPNFPGSNVREVPDGGATALLLCFAMAGLFVLRSKALVAARSK